MAFTIKQNDKRPLFVVALKDDFDTTPTAVDLTTAGTVFFSMRATGGTTVKVNRGTCAITSAASGIVTYTWQTADTNTTGDFEAEVAVVWQDGKEETFPNDSYWDVVVVDDIA